MGGYFYTASMNRPNQQKSTASSIIEIASESDVIPIFPAGLIIGNDGRGPYNLINPEAVITASTNRTYVDLVIDREHAYDLLPPGTPVKAAGWIKEFINKDGSIWARVEWTPAAQQELKNKEYRYISPTFYFDPDTREVTKIIGATLCNRPNFDMKAVASMQTTTPSTTTPEKETTEMKPLLLALAAALGLAATTSEDEILTTAAQKVGEVKTLEAAMASVKSALKAEDKADVSAVVALASQLATTKQGGEPDPSKFVSIAVHTAMATQFSELQKAVAKDKATAAVDAAMKAGKVAPAQKEWAMGYASQDLEQFNKYIETAPVIATASSETPAGSPENGAQGIDQSDAEFCSMIGLSVDDYKKQLAAEAKEKTAA